MAFKLRIAVDNTLAINTYILMPVSMTLTLTLKTFERHVLLVNYVILLPHLIIAYHESQTLKRGLVFT